MERLYYIGLDVHKKMIAYCVKDVTGAIIEPGSNIGESSEHG